jgi:putative acetyltransferase
VKIRSATQADWAAIHAIVAAAFERAGEAEIVDAVRAGGDGLVELVSEDGGEITGHVLFNRMTCRPSLALVGLAPLSVGPEHQKKGVGASLARAGLDACRALGVKGCVVLGDPAYYRRFGFARAPATLISPYARLDAFQALSFEPGIFDRTIAADYPSAFG